MSKLIGDIPDILKFEKLELAMDGLATGFYLVEEDDGDFYIAAYVSAGNVILSWASLTASGIITSINNPPDYSSKRQFRVRKNLNFT